MELLESSSVSQPFLFDLALGRRITLRLYDHFVFWLLTYSQPRRALLVVLSKRTLVTRSQAEVLVVVEESARLTHEVYFPR